MKWTPEKIADLEKRWQSGASASEIGKELGYSRSAVLGRAHRSKLPPRPRPVKEKKRTKPTPAKDRENYLKTATPAPEPVPEPVEPAETRLSNRPCQWIDGLPSASDSCKCLAPALRGRPYCPEHHARAWISPGSTTGRPFDPNLIGYVSRPPKPSKAGSGYLSAERRKGLGIG